MEAGGFLDLRPRRIGELLDLTFRVYRRRFALFACFGALTTLLMVALGLGVQLFAFSFASFDPAGVPDAAALGAMLATLPVLILLRAVIVGSGAMLIVATVQDVLSGRRSPIGAILRRAAPRMPAAAVTSLLWGVLLGIGLMLCILPGVFLAVVLALAIPAVYLERLGPLDALSRSWELVVRRGPGGMTPDTNWVRVLIIGFVTIAVLWALYGLASLPILVAQSAGQLSGMVPRGTPLGPQVLPLSLLIPLQLLGGVVQGVFFPIGVIPWALLLYDIRARHEGLDLEIRLERLRAETVAEAGAS